MFRSRLLCSYFVPVLVGLLLLVAGCAPSGKNQEARYFWPLPLPGNEPKIEYLGFVQTRQDLERAKVGWLEDAILGRERPVPLLRDPYGVASDAQTQRVFVSDSASNRVFILDFKRGEVRELLNEKGATKAFSSPRGVAVSQKGAAYVVDSLDHRIHVFGPDERQSGKFGDETLLVRPVGISVDELAGLVWVVDAMAHQLVAFDHQGNFVRRFGQRGEKPGEFNFPTDVDVDREGNLYVLDAMNARVQVFDQNLNFLRSFGERGGAPGSFRIPKGLAVSSQGDVYVTDTLDHKFIIFDGDGNYLLSIGGKFYALEKGTVSPGGFYMPRDIDIDAKGGIWIIDGLNAMLHHYQYLTEEYLAEHPIRPESVYLPPELLERPDPGRSSDSKGSGR